MVIGVFRGDISIRLTRRQEIGAVSTLADLHSGGIEYSGRNSCPTGNSDRNGDLFRKDDGVGLGVVLLVCDRDIGFGSLLRQRKGMRIAG